MADKTYVLLDDVIAHIASCERSDMLPVECSAITLIKNIPAADVTPVRHGRWIPAQDYSNGNEDIECSSCGEWFKSLELCGRLGEPNYCPVCGSKNKDGGQDE